MDFKAELYQLQADHDSQNPQIFQAEYSERFYELLGVLGHPDSHIRDDLGTTVIGRYLSSPSLPPNLRHNLLQLLPSDRFLFYEIEKGESSSSVKRSFSLLALAELLYGDADHGPSFTERQLANFSSQLRTYTRKEKDFRGVVKDLGWVHAFAHLGDCFSAVQMHPQTRKSDLIKNAQAILEFVESREFNVFHWDEHFRLARPLGRTIDRLPKEDVLTLLVKRYPGHTLFEVPYRQNLLNMFRCLYIELKERDSHQTSIFSQLTQWIR